MQNGPSIQNILEPVTLKANTPKFSSSTLRHNEFEPNIQHSATINPTISPTHRVAEKVLPQHEVQTTENALAVSVETTMASTANAMASTANAIAEAVDEKEEKGKLKWKEGKYKLGKKQFVANKYIYIPAKMMLSPTFSFAEIFPKVFEFPTPSIIFHTNRAISTSTWNVKLPQSRRYLHDVYKVATPIPRRDNMRNKDVDYSSLVSAGAKSYMKYIPGTIEHYHGVLEENVKRLLRSQYTAVTQAQAIYRVHEIWSDEFEEDVVAQWIQDSAPRGPYRTPVILGVAVKSDFHDTIWSQLQTNSFPDYDQLVKDGREPPEVILDPKPFFSGEIKVEYDPKTGHPTKSIPHPALTHLIISDNRLLLEQKLAESAPWGLVLINGGIKAAELAVLAVQLGLPLILYKYTGGTADIVIEMLDKVEKWVVAKKAQELNVHDIPPRPYPEDTCPGYYQPGWLFAFDETYVTSCNLLNVLVENWPDRHNKESVFIIDMFTTTEDEVQDRLTQTIAVVSAGEYELGGSGAEERRLSYAMRIRHKFVYNAGIFSIIADVLSYCQILFAMASTFASVLYGIYGIGSVFILIPSPTWHRSVDGNVLDYLSRANLLLPLAATIVRGVIAASNPYMKYVALKNASVQVEGEVYAFRCKVGKYSILKKADDDEEDDKGKKGKDKKKMKKKKKDEKKEGDGEGKDKGGDDAGGPNPRKAFQQALDHIWKGLAASDISNGSLMVPQFTSPAAALEDINTRIRTNRATQNAYAVPMLYGGNADKKKPEDEHPADEEEEEQEEAKGCLPDMSALTNPSSLSADAHMILDDGISMMTPDEYVLIRLNPMAAYYAAKSPSLHVAYCVIAVISNVLSILATVIAALGGVPLIPVVNAVGEGLLAYSNYKQIQLRLLQTNLALNQLNQMLVWWDSLTVIEKRVPTNVDQLVKKTEATIRAQATIFQGGGGGDGDDDKDDGNKED